MTPLTISSRSTVYVKAPVAATIAGVTVDPTADTVTMAFCSAGARPTDADFITATWETVTDGNATTYLARRLATTLTAGRYDVWVHVVHSPETVEELSGTLVVV